MPNESNIRKLENGRAEEAYKCVIEAQRPDGRKYKDNLASDYKGYVKKIPALILSNGLGNTLAYIISKGKANKSNEKNNAYDLIYEQISEWLRSGNTGCALLPGDNDLLKFVISQSSPIYRQITAETLAFMNWVRRLAEGMIGDDTNE